MDVIEFHNLNVYRTTLFANIPAILVRLPLGNWLLDYLPSSMVYQRCYIIQMTQLKATERAVRAAFLAFPGISIRNAKLWRD
jgi:hypothetical protein